MNHRVIGIEIRPEGAKERTDKPPELGKRMNGYTISVKVAAKAEGELVIETRDGAQETYRLCPNRAMYLHVGELHLSNDMNPFHFGDGNLRLAPETPLFVRGTATLEGGSISVMGDPGNEARVLAIDFYALDDEVWRKHKELAQMLGKAPHYTLVKVGLARRRPDVGTDDAWFVKCQVPPAMLRALASAVSCDAIGSISVRLALRGIYSSESRASQSVKTDWYLRPNRLDNTVDEPEMAYGNITLLKFEEAQTDSSPEPVRPLYASDDMIPALAAT